MVSAELSCPGGFLRAAGGGDDPGADDAFGDLNGGGTHAGGGGEDQDCFPGL